MIYDPLLAKLSVWGENREAAIRRMHRALGEYHVGGIRNNVAWHRRVMRHPAFVSGRYDTGFIEKHKAELGPPPPASEQAKAQTETAIVAAAVEALAKAEAQAHESSGGPPEVRSAWAESARWRS